MLIDADCVSREVGVAKSGVGSSELASQLKFKSGIGRPMYTLEMCMTG